ncbi:general transcription factor 3C polypeptide 5-like isoform X3 [Impatiens glandulifera]|nr:general transcription factor 3C polypeptide 5-like isoform X3 [Impatiens glandulifera]
MVDYQHVLALHADEARKKKRSWEDIQPKLERHGLMDVDQDDLLILVPPLFSIKDMPDNIVLKPSLTLSAKKKQESVVQQRWEMEIEPSLAIDFNIKDVPSIVYWEKYISKDSEQWNWQMIVSTLFEERPIWIKESLIARLLEKGLQFRGHILRRLLFRVAYYFSNGPFQRFWIRKAYDPRKDPESRIYQRIDFRVPPSLRSYCDANVDTGTKLRWEDICAFQVFPFKCQIYLQLDELKDDFIQKEIGKPAKQKICSLATGWFSASSMKLLRLKIAVRFLSVYPKAGAESLLKFKSDHFAKSKRRQIHVKGRVSGEGQKISNTEVVDNGDKEEANEEEEDDGDDDDDEEEEEEEEVDFDNVEDGLDPYEELNLADRINHATQQGNSHVVDNESISRNYLQELFGSFPPSSDLGNSGLNLQAGDNSDEEYQIYEPDEDDDGNYSDDDY